MNYKFQDILRLIIPGLYCLSVVGVLYFFFYFDSGNKLSKEQLDLLKNTSNIIVLMLPFLAYVIGYVTNIIFSYIERQLYQLNILRRPSSIVLSHTDKYVIGDLSFIKQDFHVANEDNIDNKKANEIFQKAKEYVLESNEVNIFYSQSIFARNISGVQFVLTILTVPGIIINNKCLFVISLFLLIVLYRNWRRQNCVYAKYVFSTYVKLKKHNSKRPNQQ